MTATARDLSADDVIARNVRAEMARAGRTQAELAEVLGIVQQSANRKVRGVTRLSASELVQVATFLDVSVEALTAGVERESAGGAA